jgi:creatinine amidohydrolase
MDRLVEDGVKEELTYSVYPMSKDLVPATGLLATARSSSPEKGKLLAKDICEKYSAILKKEFQL